MKTYDSFTRRDGKLHKKRMAKYKYGRSRPRTKHIEWHDRFEACEMAKGKYFKHQV